MKSDPRWVTVPLPEVIDFQEGPGIMARDFRDKGTPLVRLAGLNGGSLLDGCNYLDPDMVERRWAHFALREGDTLLSTSASLGRTARVTAEAVGAIAYTGLIRMRPRDGRVSSDYVRRLLQSPLFQLQVEAMGSGSVMRHFGPTHLKHMTVLVPPVKDQEDIDAIVSALDEKIESNRRLGTLLEETAAALFRARFVDFVGVTDLVESEIGPMPGGWRAASLAEVADVTMGQSPPSATYGDDEASGLPLVQGAGDFGTLYARPSRYCSAPTRTAPADAVLMTVRAPVGRLNLAAATTCLGRGVAAFVSRWPSATWLMLGSLDWRADESGTIFPAVNKRQVMEKRVSAPAAPELDEFEQVVAPLLASRNGLHRESGTLADLRDALLPKLVSGQIRVREAEEMAEAV